jgi:t-SNARE complex subunit (syntaxin)
MSELVLKYNNKDLEDLGRDVIELHETFQMVNEMIAVQAEKLDLLEDTIEETLTNSQYSNKELIIANDIQLSSIKKKIVIAGIGFTAVTITAGSFIGYSVCVPVCLVAFGCYKMINTTQKLFKD